MPSIVFNLHKHRFYYSLAYLKPRILIRKNSYAVCIAGVVILNCLNILRLYRPILALKIAQKAVF